MKLIDKLIIFSLILAFAVLFLLGKEPPQKITYTELTKISGNSQLDNSSSFTVEFYKKNNANIIAFFKDVAPDDLIRKSIESCYTESLECSVRGLPLDEIISYSINNKTSPILENRIAKYITSNGNNLFVNSYKIVEINKPFAKYDFELE